MTEPTKFAEFVLPELSKARLDGQWARIMERRAPERRRLSFTIPAVGVMVAAMALGFLWWPRDGRNNVETSGWEGSVVASDDAPVEMTLAEGTQIQVDPRSELKFLHSSAQAVQVRLGHGSARFHVAKNRSRRFSVNLGKVEVVVTGTQFRVFRKATPHGERVQVHVTEGSVEVHRGDGGVVALHAGENWSTVVPPEQRVGAAVAEPVSPEEESQEELDVAPETEEVEEPEAQDEDDERSSGVEGVDNDEDSTQAERRPSRAKRAAARRRASREAAADAGELFDHANLARRAGRLEDAAELYADVVSRYPRDRRASLAAFELGRLRMDSLRDARGAVKALERALKLDDHGAFAEDALARLVLAGEAMGDRSGCSRARARYLARYPEGVHAQHVAERCGGN